MPFGKKSITQGSKELLMKILGLHFVYVEAFSEFRAPLFYFMSTCYTIS